MVSVFLLIRLCKTLYYLDKLRKENPSHPLPEATLYFVNEKGTPFSFFRSIFWGREMEFKNQPGSQILRHEIFHVKQLHSVDILLMECFSIGFWFNPFFYVIRLELKAIHEYSADAYAASGTNNYEYASLLLLQAGGTANALTHPFFKNQIKRRIIMMTKSGNNQPGLLGRLLFLPLALLLISLFSFKIQNHFGGRNSKTIRVVIDAGHGGNYAGVRFNKVEEKNINLSIARKIQQLAKQYQVEVIMTRENDQVPGSGDLKSDLKYRADLPAKSKADLFISIHTNATESAPEGKLQTSRSGFEIYIPHNSSEVYDGSLKLGSIITETIKADYLIEPGLKQAPGDGNNILILNKATVPALLIECGYMDNPSDLKYLQDEKNQEKIARDILEGIQRYGQMSTTTDTLHLSESAVDNTSVLEMKTENQSRIEMAHDSVSPYKKVEVQAVFPGGQDAWTQYLMKNLNYPQAAEKKEIQGDVVVEFTVNIDGRLSGVHAISGPDPLRAESVRVIKESGKWTPAMDKGKKVASYKKQPINYRLQQK